MLIEFEFCTIFRPGESTKFGGGWLVEMTGAYVIVSQSHLEPDTRDSISGFPSVNKSRAVHCAMLIQRQNDVNDNDSSIQFM